MKRCILLAAACLVFAAGGSGSQLPVEVKVKKTLRWAVIEVKAVADDVTIEDIIINRGKCQLSAGTYEKKTLQRSQLAILKPRGITTLKLPENRQGLQLRGVLEKRLYRRPSIGKRVFSSAPCSFGLHLTRKSA